MNTISLENTAAVNNTTVTKEIAGEQTLEATEENKYLVILLYALFIMASSLYFNTPAEILRGMSRISISESILVSDYLVIGNLGAAFFNSGLLMLISIGLAKINKVNMNGTVISAILTVAGFAFFGKNIYNIWAILFGVYLYARIQKESYSKFILVALFGTALGQMISQISFGLEINSFMAILLSNLLGIAAGLILPALANHFIKFHQGFNIYNIGFTAGMVGTIFMALFRSFGIENPSTLIIAEGYNKELSIYLTILFTSMLFVGYLFNNNSFAGYHKILRHSGRLVDDFVISEGFGITFINSELTAFFFKAGAKEMDINIKDQEQEVVISIKAEIKNLAQEQLNILNDLNTPRQSQVEEYYWELAGENDQYQELTLVGMMIDQAEINYEDDILEVAVYRHK